MNSQSKFIGKVYGRLTILKVNYQNKDKKLYFLCKCECGNEKVICKYSILYGNTKSCGCIRKEVAIKNIWGESGCNVMTNRKINKNEYGSWISMKQRCCNKNHEKYKDYGGRGIKICDRWGNSFDNFFLDMGKKPSIKHTIDRIDNDGNYEPSNCKWSTQVEQQQNKRYKKNSNWIVFNGETKTITEWSRFLNIPRRTISYHLRIGKSFDYVFALFTPQI